MGISNKKKKEKDSKEQEQGLVQNENNGNETNDSNIENDDLETGADNNGSGKDSKEESDLDIKEVVEVDMISEVKDVRLKIDLALQLSKALYGDKSKSFHLLFISKAWLGKVLEQLGTPNPYKTKEPVKSAKDIPATADVSNDSIKNINQFKLLNEIEKITSLRDLFQQLVNSIESLDLSKASVKDGRLTSIAKTQSYVNMCEAKFELGYELGLIRDKNK